MSLGTIEQRQQTAPANAGQGTGGFIPVGLRALVIAASFGIFSVTLTSSVGSIAAVAACILACFAAERLSGSMPLAKMRLPFIIASMSAFAIVGLLLADSLLASQALALLLTPAITFNVAEAIKWFAIATSFTFCLRILAIRTNYGAILEIFFVAAAFVVTLSAHQNGMIHRPFFIGDFALSRGLDPSAILMAFGCIAVVTLAALLMTEPNQRRLPYHFTILGILCFSLVIYIRFMGLPTPQLTDDLGLTASQEGGSSGNQENPFRDGENSAEDKEAPVAVVVFRDDYEPEGGSYYFRESAYSQFNGRMLDYSTHPDMDRDLLQNFSNGTPVTPAEPLEGLGQRTAVRTTIGMLVPHRSPFALDAAASIAAIPNPNNLRFKRTYEASSLAPEFDFNLVMEKDAGNPAWSDEVRQEYLRLPDDPRYETLARQITADLKPEFADNAFARAWVIKTYLDRNGIYSLKNEHAYEQDPAASFLFGDLTGYCMHFAFAATYMYRSIGIPARVGVGYSVPAANRAGGSSLLIQAIHGHAWPEIYFEDLGWVIVDPAPQQTLVDMTTDPQDSLQQLLGDMLRNDTSFNEFIQQQDSGLLDLDLLISILGWTLLAGILAGYTVKIYRIWIPTGSALDKQYLVSYRYALDHLAAAGFSRQAGESRERFAQRIHDVSPTFTNLTNAHLSQAFGERGHNQPNAETWALARREVQHEINHSTPGWRIFVGWINPFSWMLAK